MQEVENFWSKLWEGVGTNSSNASWIEDQEKINEHQEQQKSIDITKDEIVLAMMKSSNWTAPGNDGIANFWIKNLTSIPDELTTAYNDILKHRETAPAWLTEGLTYLLPEAKETKNPKIRRTIAQLLAYQYCKKILRSTLTERSYAFLEEKELLPTEQKWWKRGSYACTEQLLINKMVLENCKRTKRNLSTAWIDYKKAFDSVPHSWIIKCLKMLKINPSVLIFIHASMEKLRTTLYLSHSNGTKKSNELA